MKHKYPTQPIKSVEEFKEKYGPKPPLPPPPSPEAKTAMKAVLNAWDPPYKPHPKKPRPANPGTFSENERALLLRGVIDALRQRPNAPAFNVWHKHGLSRVYFADDSWLSYGTDGTAIYGPDRTGDAYRLRSELGLKRAAKRAISV
jgi:hypothetical protein